jgi:hypothetical protein
VQLVVIVMIVCLTGCAAIRRRPVAEEVIASRDMTQRGSSQCSSPKVCPSVGQSHNATSGTRFSPCSRST